MNTTTGEKNERKKRKGRSRKKTRRQVRVRIVGEEDEEGTKRKNMEEIIIVVMNFL